MTEEEALDRMAVTQAYTAQVQALFKVLVGNLAGDMPEAAALDRFDNGMAIARLAKKLALETVGND